MNIYFTRNLHKEALLTFIYYLLEEKNLPIYKFFSPCIYKGSMSVGGLCELRREIKKIVSKEGKEEKKFFIKVNEKIPFISIMSHKISLLPFSFCCSQTDFKFKFITKLSTSILSFPISFNEKIIIVFPYCLTKQKQKNEKFPFPKLIHLPVVMKKYFSHTHRAWWYFVVMKTIEDIFFLQSILNIAITNRSKRIPIHETMRKKASNYSISIAMCENTRERKKVTSALFTLEL